MNVLLYGIPQAGTMYALRLSCDAPGMRPATAAEAAESLPR
jgi:hypothetical protein